VPRSFAGRSPFAASGAPGAGIPASDAESLFARVARRLAPNGIPRTADGFESRYVVTESTPIGAVRAALEVSARGADVRIVRDVANGRRATAPADGAHGSVRERLLAVAMRQPAILLAYAESGSVVIGETSVPCDDGACPALLAELDDGSELELVIDAATLDPVELRTRWCCSADEEPHDEILSYLAWIESAGVRIASRMSADDEAGGDRDLELVDWEWLPGEETPGMR
jgi:hypothetical protein